MRSLVRLIAKLRHENAVLRDHVARLKGELHGNDWDIDIDKYIDEQMPTDQEWYCVTCNMSSHDAEHCGCSLQ
jgi:hypothetical protein